MTWHRVCEFADLPAAEKGGAEFVVAGNLIAVFRLRDEQVAAIDGMCAHQGGPLAQGKLDGRCLTCPWHGWQYDITNGHNVLTDKPMLSVYAVEVRDGEVWIELPE